jgi:hypothetical protein
MTSLEFSTPRVRSDLSPRAEVAALVSVAVFVRRSASHRAFDVSRRGRRIRGPRVRRSVQLFRVPSMREPVDPVAVRHPADRRG